MLSCLSDIISITGLATLSDLNVLQRYWPNAENLRIALSRRFQHDLAYRCRASLCVSALISGQVSLMRLLYLHNAPVPSTAANAIQVAKMCQAFKLSGAEISLVTPAAQDASSGDPYDQIASFYGLNRDNEFKAYTVPVYPIRGRWLLFSLIALVPYIFRRPDIVFTRSPACAFVASSILGFKTILELHDPVSNDSRKNKFYIRKLLSTKSFRRFVVTSNRLKDDLLEIYPSASDKILVAPNGADTVDLSLPCDRKLLEGSFVVGYVGQLYPGKGMEIISELAPRCKFATFHIVGGTAEDVTYWQARLSSQSNVVFHGYVRHSEVRSYLESMDVVVAPYLRDVRGVGGGDRNIADGMSPLKLFEYMSHGKAIVTSDLPPIREILKNFSNSLLINPDSIQDWADALGLLCSDDALREAIANQAKIDFVNFFSREARAQNLLKVMS